MMLHRFLIPLILVVLSTATPRALGSFEVRAKADNPFEADREGWSVALLDPEDGSEIIWGSVAVPENFGKLDLAVITLKDATGQLLGELTLAESPSMKGRTPVDFRLRRDLLANSILSVGHMSEEEGIQGARFILGTFSIKTRSQLHGKPMATREVYHPRVALAEFGRLGFMGEEEFSVTDKISTEKGEHYGIRLYLRGDGRSLPVRIESGTPGDMKPLHAGMIATEKLVDYHLWESSPDDPPGEHEVRVYVQDRLIKTLKFTVPPPVKEGARED